MKLHWPINHYRYQHHGARSSYSVGKQQYNQLHNILSRGQLIIPKYIVAMTINYNVNGTYLEH